MTRQVRRRIHYILVGAVVAVALTIGISVPLAVATAELAALAIGAALIGACLGLLIAGERCDGEDEPA